MASHTRKRTPNDTKTTHAYLNSNNVHQAHQGQHRTAFRRSVYNVRRLFCVRSHSSICVFISIRSIYYWHIATRVHHQTGKPFLLFVDVGKKTETKNIIWITRCENNIKHQTKIHAFDYKWERRCRKCGMFQSQRMYFSHFLIHSNADQTHSRRL